jgi:Berberine and berberine like
MRGWVSRIGVTDTAFPHRWEGFNLLVLAEWMDHKDNDACIAWARNSYATTQPYMGVNRYVNYLADDERGEAVVAAYGPNYRRLQQIKAKYDPDNGRVGINPRSRSARGSSPLAVTCLLLAAKLAEHLYSRVS